MHFNRTVLDSLVTSNVLPQEFSSDMFLIYFSFAISKMLLLFVGSRSVFHLQKHLVLKDEIFEQFADLKMITEINFKMFIHNLNKVSIPHDSISSSNGMNIVSLPLREEITAANELNTDSINSFTDWEYFKKEGFINICFHIESILLLKSHFKYLDYDILSKFII